MSANTLYLKVICARQSTRHVCHHFLLEWDPDRSGSLLLIGASSTYSQFDLRSGMRINDAASRMRMTANPFVTIAIHQDTWLIFLLLDFTPTFIDFTNFRSLCRSICITTRTRPLVPITTDKILVFIRSFFFFFVRITFFGPSPTLIPA